MGSVGPGAYDLISPVSARGATRPFTPATISTVHPRPHMRVKTPGPGQYEVLKPRESKYEHPDRIDSAAFKSKSPRVPVIKSDSPSPSNNHIYFTGYFTMQIDIILTTRWAEKK